LLRRELEDIVGIEIDAQPYQNDHSECDIACTIFDGREEGKQKDPEGGIIGFPNEGEGVGEPLFD
jgi:hypothetical protein